MVSPVVSAGFQKMVNLYRSVCIVSIHILIFMNVYYHVYTNILHHEHVCTTYIHLDIFMFMVQTCTYTFVIS